MNRKIETDWFRSVMPFGGRDGPVKELRETSPQARHRLGGFRGRFLGVFL